VPSGPTSVNTSFRRSRVRATIITSDTANNTDVTTETPDTTAANTAPNDTTATPNGHKRNRASSSAKRIRYNLLDANVGLLKGIGLRKVWTCGGRYGQR